MRKLQIGGIFTLFLLLSSALFLFGQSISQTVMAAAQQAAQPPPNPMDVPRFLRLNEGFAIGGQPTTAGIRKLSELGFKTIVNLATLREGSMLEAKTVEFYSMKFVNLECDPENFKEENVQAFFQVIENKDDQPMYVHCKNGSKAVAMWMIYRVKKNGVKLDTALAEATEMGLTKESPMREAALKYLQKSST